jgi:hypothetical protein
MQQQVEQGIAPYLHLLEAYAVQQHLTVPAARRKVNDLEWIADALVALAGQRLAELESKGELTAGQ